MAWLPFQKKFELEIQSERAKKVTRLVKTS